MDKNLIVRYGEESFNVSMNSRNEQIVMSFISWIKKYKHGKFNNLLFEIECKREKDFIACRIKAKHSGLLSTKISKN